MCSFGGWTEVTWPCRLRCNISRSADSIESNPSWAFRITRIYMSYPQKSGLNARKKQMKKPETSIQIFRKWNVASTEFPYGTIHNLIRALQSLFQKINFNTKFHNSIACYWFPPWQYLRTPFLILLYLNRLFNRLHRKAGVMCQRRQVSPRAQHSRCFYASNSFCPI